MIHVVLQNILNKMHVLGRIGIDFSLFLEPANLFHFFIYFNFPYFRVKWTLFVLEVIANPMILFHRFTCKLPVDLNFCKFFCPIK